MIDARFGWAVVGLDGAACEPLEEELARRGMPDSPRPASRGTRRVVEVPADLMPPSEMLRGGRSVCADGGRIADGMLGCAPRRALQKRALLYTHSIDSCLAKLVQASPRLCAPAEPRRCTGNRDLGLPGLPVPPHQLAICQGRDSSVTRSADQADRVGDEAQQEWRTCLDVFARRSSSSCRSWQAARCRVGKACGRQLLRSEAMTKMKSV